MIARSRIALGNFHYARFSFAYFLEAALSLGIDNIELWAAAPHFCLDTIDNDSMSATKRLIDEHGLRVVCLTPEQCSYPVNIATPDESLRRYSVKNFMKAVDAASYLDCPRVLVTAGCGYFDQSREQAWGTSLESMTEIGRYAARSGVELAYEPLSAYSSNIVNNATQLAAMLEELGNPSIQGMLDTGQMALIGESIEDYPRLLGKRLTHVHLVDGAPAGHLVIGDGCLPIAEYVAALETSGYAGYYSLEITDIRYRLDPAQADERGLKWLEDHEVIGKA